MNAKIGDTLKHDLPASIVVFLVALPLCLGIAIASGVPPALGLVTGIVGGILVGVFAGSPLQVSGPAAGLAVIVWEIVHAYGLPALGIVVLLAGAIQVGAALLGWGGWFRAISPPVVYGMLAGIGVLIVASQFHVMVDDKPASSPVDNILSIPAAIYKGISPTPGTSHQWAAGLGILTIAIIVGWVNFRPKRLQLVPGPLVAIVVAVAIAQVTGAPVQYVQLPDDLGDALIFPSAAAFDEMSVPSLAIAAMTVAIVASAETLLCTGAVDRMQDRVKAEYNRELFAQGLGNCVCGFLGALPMTGVIVRSSANVDAGARTRASAILHGIWILALVLAFPQVLRVVPTAGLAAILVYTGYKLVNPAHIRELREFGWSSVVIYAATIAGIVFTDLLKGVLLGVALSVGRLVYRLGRLSVDVRTSESGRRTDAHLRGAATFIALPKLQDALEHLPGSEEVHLHVDSLSYIDHACLEAIGDWERRRRQRGERVSIEWHSLESRSDKVSVRPLSGRTDSSPATP